MSKNFNSKKSFSQKKSYSRGYNSRPNHKFNRRRRRRPNSQKINIVKFINKANVNVDKQNQEDDVTRLYSDFDLHYKLQQNIKNKGFEKPTPIQDKVIDHILEAKDILGIANTGTGKTGAFLIPLIHETLLDRSHKTLIITPTRELAIQIDNELRSLTNRLNMYSVVCIGGANIYRQQKGLKRNFNFVVGTPGRLKDLIKRKYLNIFNFKNVVLDEVDRMLDMGFYDDVSDIMQNLPKQRRSLFFSATTNDRVNSLINKFSQNLMTISVKRKETADTVDQNIVKYKNNQDKIEVLHKLLISDGFDKVLVFGKTKRGVNDLYNELSKRGFMVNSIHGNKSQSQRQRALTGFKQNRVHILIATDVAARGLDILDITHVINYDLPQTYDDYIHRIGRTGRANKVGKALTFIKNN